MKNNKFVGKSYRFVCQPLVVFWSRPESRPTIFSQHAFSCLSSYIEKEEGGKEFY